MNILEEINQHKINEVRERLSWIAPDLYFRTDKDKRVPEDFLGALSGDDFAFITEIKKASPSKGVIRQDFDPVSIAKAYAMNGASCLSVLTDERYFQGKNEYIWQIKETVDIPILRKDFIVDIRQIRESFEMGADAILLIVASLTNEQMKEFSTAAKSFGLSVLVETHSIDEAKRAVELNADIVGVNNRDLRDFKTDLQTSLDIKPHLSADSIKISESGINYPEDCARLKSAGFNGVLVG